MSSFIDLCASRQSCRKFSDKPVEREKLISCVEAARLAPSGCNSQPWSFILVRDPALVAKVAKATMQLELNSWTDTVPAFFVVIEEHAVLMPKLRCVIDSQYFAGGDVGAATAYLCLEAEAQGLGTCVLGMFDRENLSQILDIPADKRIRLIVAAGYQEEPIVRPKKRKPLEQILWVVE